MDVAPSGVIGEREEDDMAAFDPATLDRWRALAIVDRDGTTVGTISEFYLDRESGEPTWALVETGLFGATRTFVPLVHAVEVADGLQVPYEKDHIKDAPGVDLHDELTPDEEATLFAHYGVDYQPSTSGPAETPGPVPPDAVDPDPGPAATPPDLAPEGPGPVPAEPGSIESSDDPRPGRPASPPGDPDPLDPAVPVAPTDTVPPEPGTTDEAGTSRSAEPSDADPTSAGPGSGESTDADRASADTLESGEPTDTDPASAGPGSGQPTDDDPTSAGTSRSAEASDADPRSAGPGSDADSTSADAASAEVIDTDPASAGTPESGDPPDAVPADPGTTDPAEAGRSKRRWAGPTSLRGGGDPVDGDPDLSRPAPADGDPDLSRRDPVDGDPDLSRREPADGDPDLSRPAPVEPGLPGSTAATPSGATTAADSGAPADPSARPADDEATLAPGEVRWAPGTPGGFEEQEPAERPSGASDRWREAKLAAERERVARTAAAQQEERGPLERARRRLERLVGGGQNHTDPEGTSPADRDAAERARRARLGLDKDDPRSR